MVSKRASVGFNVGYRNDELEWRFRDPRLTSFVDTLIGVFDPITQDLPLLEEILPIIENSRLGCVIDNILGLDDLYKSQWKHLNMVNVGLEGRLETCCGIYGRFNGNYGWIAHGKYQPRGAFNGSTEFLANTLSNQGLAPSPRKNVQGHSWDVDLGVGYNLKFCCETFQIAPMLGWSYYNMNLRTYKDRAFMDLNGDINLRLFDLNIDLGELQSFGKGKAFYNAYWTGPWVGFDADYRYDCNWSLFMTFEYHYSRHIGKGHARSYNHFVASSEVIGDQPISRLPDTFAFDLYGKNRFRNHVSIQGYKVGGGINYTMNDCMYAGFKIDYYHMRKVKNGTVKVKSESYIDLLIVNAEGEEEGQRIDLNPRDSFCLSGIRWKSLRYEIEFGVNF